MIFFLQTYISDMFLPSQHSLWHLQVDFFCFLARSETVLEAWVWISPVCKRVMGQGTADPPYEKAEYQRLALPARRDAPSTDPPAVPVTWQQVHRLLGPHCCVSGGPSWVLPCLPCCLQTQRFLDMTYSRCGSFFTSTLWNELIANMYPKPICERFLCIIQAFHSKTLGE